MNLSITMRRNRFKNPSIAKKSWVLPRFVTEWRIHARRAALLLLLTGALSILIWALDRPVRVISMDGSFQRVSPGQIEKAVATYAHAGFMSANLSDIQRAVEALPWVDHARIARRWPNSLHVAVTEQTAAARWGESGLLNTRGELFVKAAAHVPAELPRLSGPTGSESQVAQRYMSTQGRMLEAGMRIAALRLDERGAWEMDLDSGVTVRLGRRDVDARIERFIHTASQVIAHRMAEISYVDMRYSNGFAIGWRNQGTSGSGALKRSDDTDA
ncbi:MAG TPA: cell division protein FtsQ/DivIB [Steroidobacteraceae bacterium]|jgi:cell division protein FtsQ|nr:cell division protein FtsQ/DivIB [Steroidobacteraceae bacterium]